ncbi:cell division protein FtsQ/DivIB [Streptococcus saliviloxodontae]|uniref:Cell division protein DivIB n=1 Tax=Streptococcus saliviloxodontae TaxID=1349416 RepID=A0ABS2PJ05_9STRE|nr:FtsQ-type POTRA domain-containing protein [Streptococcus saliviloxodontae]MBM7635409.1 cell division protein FtsQ [Streptococcus saliviloxodontae]
MANKTPEEHKEEQPLTEWQKRNLEFLQKKARDQKEKEEQTARLKAQQKARLTGSISTAEENSKEVTAKKAKKEKTKAKKAGKKVATVKKLSKKEEVAKRRLRSIVIPSMVIFLISLFMVSPLSKLRVVKVVGQTNTTEQAVKSASGIKSTDYLAKTFFSQSRIASRVARYDKWVKSATVSYQFWNTFTIKVKEYSILAYLDSNNGYSPILEDGTVVTEKHLSSLPDNSLSLKLKKAKQIQLFVKQFSHLSSKLQKSIRTVSLAGSQSTPDLLILEMSDGNTVKVPLSQLSQKLPYYTKIVANMTDTGIVDMEVGIYTTTSDIEDSVAAALSSTTETSESSQDSASQDSSETTATSLETTAADTTADSETSTETIVSE